MNAYEIIDIPLSSLLINDENPRFDKVNNQREAIKVMIDKQGEKLLNLASDIVEAGINPSDLVIVVKEGEDNEMYPVLEGNRRITALKLLSTPSLMDGLDNNFKMKMAEISKKFNPSAFEKIKCVVFENPDKANRWVELKHTGEQGGKGIVKWDSYAQQRFNERQGRKSIGLQAIDFLREVTDDEDLKKKLNHIPLSNMERLLRDPDIRNTIGIQIENETLKTDLIVKEVKKGLEKIAKDLSGNIKVQDIYYKDDREKYIASFSKIEFPDITKKTEASWELDKYDEKNKPTPSRKKTVPKSTTRKSLIPSNCVIYIDDPPRANCIYHEMRSLNVNKFPNVSSVMLRVFLELTINEFIEIHNIRNPGKHLYQRLQRVADYLQSKQIMTEKQLTPIRAAHTTNESVLSTSTLNAYVHHKNFSPMPEVIKISWDNMQEFIEILWNEIDRKTS